MRPVLGRIPHLYFLDPDEGRDREGRKVTPDFVVDVGRVYGAEEANAGVPCEPAGLAAEASRDGQLHRDDGAVDSGSRPIGGLHSVKGTGSIVVIRTRNHRCFRNCWGMLVRNTSGA